jgi:hypothetical protein
MKRDHLDVLQNIEFTLVQEARNDPKIDDATIDQALGNCLDQTNLPADADSRVVRLCFMRDVREDVSDELWRAGLRTVRKSVRTHSSLAPGDTGYLDFVRPYVR